MPAAIWEYNKLIFAMVKKGKWGGLVTSPKPGQSDKGTVNSEREKKRWEDIMKEQIGVDFASTTTVAETGPGAKLF